MTRLSSLLFLTVASLALAAPALAKTSIAGAENLCKAEVKKVHSPKSIKVDKDETKATNTAFIYIVKIKGADDANAKVRCTVDRESSAVALAVAE
ncbi:MAG TPA: hypothetical protein VGO52_23965 [Hyphomonadaceae bacterium]|jgi:hypothetical protein|nr:hypothetical protein [Hyphomonadaceae bacterium]